MRRNIILVIIFFLSAKFNAAAQVHLGAGPEYFMPLSEAGKVNEDSPGVSLVFESRKYCNLWYGFKIDYISLNKIKDIDSAYFKDAFVFSPEFRYVFTYGDCSHPAINFYAQGLVNISSIGGWDNAGRLGLGAGLGGGASVPFVLLKKCCAVDLNVLYQAPNFILRADNRAKIQFFSIGLIFSMGL